MPYSDNHLLKLARETAPGQYVPVDEHAAEHAIYPEEGIIGDLYVRLKTDRYQSAPIIGTAEDEACLTIFLVNRSDGKATTVMEHSPTPGAATLHGLYKALDAQETDIVDVVMIGMAENIEESSEHDAHTLTQILEAVSDYPNLRLAVCDTGNKRHPTAFGIDTRRGVPDDPSKPITLLRGTEMVSSLKEAIAVAEQYKETYMGYWTTIAESNHSTPYMPSP